MTQEVTAAEMTGLHMAVGGRDETRGFDPFRLAFDHSPAGLALIAGSGTIDRANAVLASMFGCSEGELAGLDFSRLIHPGDLARLPPVSSLAGEFCGEASTDGVDVRGIRPDGRTIWIRVRQTALCGVDGARIAVLIAAEDITARRKSAESQARMEAVIEASTDVRGIFEGCRAGIRGGFSST